MSDIKLEYSRSTVRAGMFAGFVLGCAVGIFLGDVELVRQHNQVKEQCEEHLLRSQECVVEMVGKVVEDKLSR